MEAHAHFQMAILNNHPLFAIFVTSSIFEKSSEKPLSDISAVLIFLCKCTRDPSVERY
ncbi:conserved hypothetical protein [Vibrio owensii]|nr:conserved hypothetical protein [Vibrio owensii]